MTIVSSRGQQFLREVVLDTTGCMLTVDDDGIVVFTTERAKRLLGSDPEDVVGSHVATFFSDDGSPLERIRRTAEGSGSTHVSLLHEDGYDVPGAVSVEATEHDGERYYTLTLRESRSQERQARRLEETERFLRQVFERSTEAMVVFDPERDEIVDCNERACELLGYEREELLDLEPSTIYRHTTDAFDAFVETVIETGSARTEDLVCEIADGESLPVETSASLIEMDERLYVLTHARKRGPEESSSSSVPTTSNRPIGEHIEALNDVIVELMAAETTAEIGQLATDAVEDILECDVGCVRLYDDETNRLRPVAMTDGAQRLVDSRPAFDLDVTSAGRAYRTGEIVTRRRDHGDRFDETPVRTTLHAPLGDHGTVTVGCADPDGFDDVEVEGLRLLAANVESALDHAERTSTLRKREERLRRQRDELATVDRINRLVHELIEVLIDGETRDAIEERICVRLAESEHVQSAWIGAFDPVEETVTTQAGAGVDEEYLRAIDELPFSRIANGSVERAIEADEAVVDQRRVVAGNGSEAAESSGRTETTVAAPIRYGDRTFGVVVLTAARENTFGTTERESLELLGDVIGFVLNVIQKEILLLSDEVVRLEFEVTDPDCLAVHLSEKLECHCRIDRTVLTPEGTYLNYVTLKDASGVAACEAATDVDSVTDCRIVTDSGQDCSLEVVRTECGTEAMLEFGATMQTAEAEDGTGRLVVEAPQSADVRQLVEAYGRWNPDSELVAKRELDRTIQTAPEFRQSLEDDLTEKQRTTLEAAYAAGYYEWPRESTAEEVAESMGIASATFHQHLRTAIRELLSEFLEDE
ncbi:bacterio-opsin activator domain-containing protein [Natrialbaceae archaeon A-gly3]